MRFYKCMLHALTCLSCTTCHAESATKPVYNIQIAIKFWMTSRETTTSKFGDISTWKLNNLKSLDELFYGKTSFNHDLSGWDVSKATSATYTFGSATNFNGDISSWNVGKVTNVDFMFKKAKKFNRDLSTWDLSSVTSMEGMFAATSDFNQDLDAWDVSAITNMYAAFWEAEAFNGSVSSWDVSNVESMYALFYQSSFNRPIVGWQLSSITNADMMFYGAKSFNNIIDWEMGKVTTLATFFFDAISFNGEISKWDTANIVDLSSCFEMNSAFNSYINDWDVSSVTKMDYTFYYAGFNNEIGAWDTSNLESVLGTFQYSMFNTDLSRWQTSNIETMEGMFKGATDFNQDISSWNTISLTEAKFMFQDTSSFNQDLTKWNVTNLVKASFIFQRATAFNQNICWDFPALGEQRRMFSGSEGELNCCKDNSEFVRRQWRQMTDVTCLDIHNLNAGGDIRRDICRADSEFEKKTQQIRGWCPNACGTDCTPTAAPTMWPTTLEPTSVPTETPSTSTPTKDMSCVNTANFSAPGSRYGSTRDIKCASSNIKWHRSKGRNICTTQVKYNDVKKSVREWCPKACDMKCCEDDENFVKRFRGKQYTCSTPGIVNMCELAAEAGNHAVQIKEICPLACGYDCTGQTSAAPTTEPTTEAPSTSAPTKDMSCENTKQFRVAGSSYDFKGDIRCTSSNINWHRSKGKNVCATKVRYGGIKRSVREWCPKACDMKCCEDDKDFVRRHDGIDYKCRTPGIVKMCEFDAQAGNPAVRIKEICPLACGFDCTGHTVNKYQHSQAHMNYDPNCKDNLQFRINVKGKELSCEDTRLRYKVCDLKGRLGNDGPSRLVSQWCKRSCGNCPNSAGRNSVGRSSIGRNSGDRLYYHNIWLHSIYSRFEN